MRLLLPFYLLVLLMLAGLPALAGNIRGKVVDAATGEPLTGVSVAVEGTKLGGIAGLDGTYEISHVPDGHYTLTVSYLGYQKSVQSADIGADEATISFRLVAVRNTVDEVIIAGKRNKESDQFARRSEQNAVNVMNIISARAIEVSPDITVANVLQRVSGISMERNSSGEANYAIIRGMDKRYNYTLVNGIKIPSPDPRNRYVPMDIFPADLLERLEVIKALTPNMEGDAIGGAMNMVMKSAPERMGLKVSLAGGFSQYVADNGFQAIDKSVLPSMSPSEAHGNAYPATPADFSNKIFDYNHRSLPLNYLGNFSVGDRFGKHKRFGLLVAGSYQKNYKSVNGFLAEPNGQPDPGNKPTFTDLDVRTYSTETNRYGLHAVADYRINRRNTITWYNSYVKLDEFQQRHTVDSEEGIHLHSAYINDRTRVQKQNIFSSNLHGEHQLNEHFSVDWNGVYSRAENKIPYWAEFSYSAPGDVVQAYSPQFWHNTDKDLTGIINTHYRLHIGNMPVTLSAGGFYRHKQRDNYYNKYKLSTAGSEPFTTVDAATFIWGSTDAELGDTSSSNIYTATENIAAWYGMATLEITKKLQLLAGIRSEQTDLSYETNVPETTQGKSGEYIYSDLLPSAHLTYKLSSRQNARLSYFRGISRPGFAEVVPLMQSATEDFQEWGNSSLTRATSDNLDARYEWYPTPSEQILAGAFYKKIYDPIELLLSRQGTSNIGTEVLRAINNSSPATNYGFELVFTRYFRNFGINLNYTYTNSSITTTKSYYYHRDATNNDTTVPVSQTRPLQGQSNHIGNVAFLYKNQHLGLDAQFAVVYTGPRIRYISPYEDLDYWQKGTVLLDFSAEKTITKHFTAFVKINNLLNSKAVTEIRHSYDNPSFPLPYQTDITKRIVVQQDQYGQSYLFGIRYHF